MRGKKSSSLDARAIKRFSIERRKTKTKLITLTNHSGRKQNEEPIRTRSKGMQMMASSAGKRVRTSHDFHNGQTLCAYILANLFPAN